MPHTDQTRPYTVTITDVTTGRDVILAAVDLTDDQKRELVAHVLRLTNVPLEMGDAFVDEAAPKPDKPSQLAVRSFTLDTNCVIAIDEGREPAASAIRRLADAHEKGVAKVALVAISASERQQGPPLNNFKQFKDRLEGLGLGRLEILPALSYWGISFWDWSLWSGDEALALERRIHDILFPTSQFLWEDFCTARGLDAKTPISGAWRNHKCDVLAMWSHIHAKRDVFVTDDGNFLEATKKSQLIGLGAGTVANSAAAAAMLP